jgi:hypothetical protein
VAGRFEGNGNGRVTPVVAGFSHDTLPWREEYCLPCLQGRPFGR